MQGEFSNGGIFKPTIRKFPVPAGALLKNCLSPMAKVQLQRLFLKIVRLVYFKSLLILLIHQLVCELY